MRVKPELPADFAEARANLRPKLWSRSITEHLRLKRLYSGPPEGGLDLPCQPIGEHVLACLGYDWPESVQSINQENLEQWGVSVYEALEAAKQNLDESTLSVAKIGDHLFSFVSGDSYDAVRLLLVDRIKEFDLTGIPVAMIANRDSILITGSDDAVGLAMMAELAAKGLEEPYSLSGVPLILDDGEWIGLDAVCRPSFLCTVPRARVELPRLRVRRTEATARCCERTRGNRHLRREFLGGCTTGWQPGQLLRVE